MGTPIRSRSANPGAILIHDKWKNTSLSRELRGKFNNVYHQEMGSYDFRLNGDKNVIYIPEANLVTAINCQKYLDLAKNDRTVIIAVRNTITVEQYSVLQDALVISNNKKLIPVGDASEIPELLHIMAHQENTPKKIPKSPCVLPCLNILLNIPGMGKLKAEKLLDTFGTVNQIASSSVSELSSQLGLNLASEVYKYFH